MTTDKLEILKFNPCSEAVEFRKQYSTFKEAWKNCPRGDWMLWLAKKLNVELKTLTLAKVRCASTVRHLMKDQRSLTALDVALKFANGEATKQELNDAADAAAYAAYAAAYAAAAYAAAAYAAAADADDAADAADAAAYAADAADAARKQNQKSTADICREVLTETVFEKLGI